MKKSVHHRSKGPMDRRFESAGSALASGVYLSVGSPLALDLLGKTLCGDFLGVINCEINACDYKDASSFRDDYLCSSLMSKFPDWDIGIDRTAVALDKFHSSERKCAETNYRLRQPVVNGLIARITPESIIWMARDKIQRLLGSFSWDLAERHFGFGRGATTSLRHVRGDAYYKYREKPCATSDCAVLAYTAISRVPSWYSWMVSLTGIPSEDFEVLPLSEKIAVCIEIVEGNRICTVPKNAKCDRTIAIEPTMNSYIQKGIGGCIRSKLRRVGVDLNDQRKNQRLAKLGSESGLLATVDLSSASDSVSTELVSMLLPPDWVAAINLCRSPVGVLPDGSKCYYQKVSSMGCGFTFELESLIFWALSSSVMNHLKLDRVDYSTGVDRLPCVFGDDIIVPASAVPTLKFILEYVGFSFNREKTFSDGPFRESCGKHYFRGVDVTPIYIRKDVVSPDRLIWFCNQIRRWSRLLWGLDGRLWPAWEFARSLLPESLQVPAIPDGFGDVALIGDLDEVCPPRQKWSLDHWLVKFWVPLRKSEPKGDVPYLVRSLAGMNEGQPELDTRFRIGQALHSVGLTWVKERWFADSCYGVVLPQSAKWRVVKGVPVTQWPSYGPWLGLD